MRRFDYSFLAKGSIPAKFINLATMIYSLRERSNVRFREHPDIYRGLEGISRFQSVKASNAIEGIVTTDERIKSILDGSSEPLTHDEKEIDGYKVALIQVHENYRKMDFTEGTILSLHEKMYSKADVDFGGRYKKADNLIAEIDASGHRRIRFIPISAEETSEAMEQLSIAYIVARSDPSINNLLLIPCAILDFLCIHPFSDGNGRLSRLLSLLLLYKEGFDIGKYISFEKQIDERKDYYYEALRLSSIDWGRNANDYFPFAEDFLSTLYHCYKEMDDRFAILGDGRFSKRDRVEATVLNRLTPISKEELCSLLPDISLATIELALGEMVKEGKIERIGLTRGSRYIRKQR